MNMHINFHPIMFKFIKARMTPNKFHEYFHPKNLKDGKFFKFTNTRSPLFSLVASIYRNRLLIRFRYDIIMTSYIIRGRYYINHTPIPYN